MPGTSHVLTPPPFPTLLSSTVCRALLARTCFGHLSLIRRTHVDTLPIRFAFADGWLYFRADNALRHALGHNSWVTISITETIDQTHVMSVVARGACYGTEHTGSADDDLAALRGIMRLRDRVPVGVARARWVERTSTVVRMHIDELRGRTTLVPCPAGGESRRTRGAVGLDTRSDLVAAGRVADPVRSR